MYFLKFNLSYCIRVTFHQILLINAVIELILCIQCCNSDLAIKVQDYYELEATHVTQEDNFNSDPWPRNMTVERTSSTSVKIKWLGKSDPDIKWQLEYYPVKAQYRILSEVSRNDNCKVLESLVPKTTYEVKLVGLINKTAVWSSETITFSTTFISTHPERSSVRPEEISIVILVLAFWMCAIALFFNRWGKIRMLEPYFEPFKEPPVHRASCPGLGESSILTKFHFMDYQPPHSRPRLGSLAVGRSYSISAEMPPRRVRSAVNLTSLVLHECDEELSSPTAEERSLSPDNNEILGSITTAV